VAYENGQGVSKDDAEAVRWYRKAAELGEMRAMTNLGVMLATGSGVAKDEVEAVRWFRKAAEAGNALGMKNLGVAYENGQGVSKDDAEAVRWYRKAAELGEMRAMTSLGFMYENGRGIGKDEAEAVRWYRKAADFGEMRAMTNLGFMYETGRGIGKDEAEAVRWYSKAATGRFPRALYLLGLMNFEGRGGLAKNYAAAVRLINQAAEAGFALAKSWVAKSGTAPSSGQQAQGAPKRITVGGNVQQVKLISQPKPLYPPLAKQARISGVVRLNAIIGRDGAIQSITSVVGHPLLVPAARDAVKQWRYQPTLIDGEPVEVVTQIDVNFTLNQ
jgi:TonB family protein